MPLFLEKQQVGINFPYLFQWQCVDFGALCYIPLQSYSFQSELLVSLIIVSFESHTILLPTSTASNCIVFLSRWHDQSSTQYSMSMYSGDFYNGMIVLSGFFLYSFAINSLNAFLTTAEHGVTPLEVTHGFKISFLTD